MSPQTRPAYAHLELRREGRVAIVRLNRPQALNALDAAIMQEVVGALLAQDADPEVGAMVLTGSERAFAAGADIKEMLGAGPIEMMASNTLAFWDELRRVEKPLIAAVSGYCLGGGCELALACDMIVASETAQFGQPEVKIGVIPGAGGTQRLTRLVGKFRAMELVLTGEPIGAAEALRIGLVNRVVPVELYLEEAVKLATVVASRPPLALKLAKEAILAVDETDLTTGLKLERKSFYTLFASEDQREGMRAFVEKRQPTWQGK